MPLHGYSTDRRPPTNFDHLLAHPYAIGLAAFQIFAGSLVTCSMVFGFSFNSSALALPRMPLFALCLVLILGGLNVIRGLFDDSNDLRKGFRIERGGLILSGAGWTSYTVAVLIGNTGGILGWSMGLFFSAMLALRLVAGRREERRVDRETRDLKL